MYPERSTAACRQDLQIPQRLRRLHDAERVTTTRNRQIGRLVTRDLQKHPRGATPLERLTGRV